MNRSIVAAFVAALFVASACSGDTNSTLAARTTPTPDATAGQSPAAVPTPASKVVVVKNKGSRVAHVTLAAISYTVAWTAKGGTCFGSAGCNGDNFVVDIVGAGGASDNIINEITIYKGSSGETLYTINDPGAYILKVDASSLSWTLTFTPA